MWLKLAGIKNGRAPQDESGHMLHDCFHRKVDGNALFRRKMRESRSPFDIFLAVQSIGERASADELIAYVVRAYLYTPPDEGEMRKLSHLQQVSAGRGDAIEYATLTVFVGANEALIRIEESYEEIRRLLTRLRDASGTLRRATPSKRSQSCPDLARHA